MKCSTKDVVSDKWYVVRKRPLGFLIFLSLTTYHVPLLSACPLCVEAISKVSGLAKGLNWSILLMLGVPVLVVSVISGIILKANRHSAAPKE